MHYKVFLPHQARAATQAFPECYMNDTFLVGLHANEKRKLELFRVTNVKTCFTHTSLPILRFGLAGSSVLASRRGTLRTDKRHICLCSCLRLSAGDRR